VIEVIKVVYKLKKKNDFEFHVKSGSKIVEKISKASGGWYVCCRIFDSIEDALSYWKKSHLNTLSVFDDRNFEICIVD
jgi:hypothetical protein